MHLAIVGSRDFTDWETFVTAVDTFREGFQEPFTAIVSGGAKGADIFARRYSLLYDMEMREYPAQWDKHGKGAGFIRNTFIVDDADALLAFYGPNGETKGTTHSLNLAKEKGIPYAVYYQGENE